MIHTAFLGKNPAIIDKVYARGRKEQVFERSQCCDEVITPDDFQQYSEHLNKVEAVFGTWGFPKLTPEQLAYLPNLKAVFYAAGSVKGFASPLLEAGIRVSSAWQANAVPVAEFSLAQILLANKNYFQAVLPCSASAERRQQGGWPPCPGNFGVTVTLLGAGAIGTHLIELLKPFQIEVLVWDPFLSAEQAEELGVTKVDSLDEAFSNGYVVSNHLANVPETRNLLREQHFAVMPHGATFINTGRGATLAEDELAAVLRRRPDLVALLDVSHPEPPQADSPLYEVENALISPHIAGSAGNEVIRMADYALAEFDRWSRGEALQYEVTPEMLATMA